MQKSRMNGMVKSVASAHAQGRSDSRNLVWSTNQFIMQVSGGFSGMSRKFGEGVEGLGSNSG